MSQMNEQIFHKQQYCLKDNEKFSTFLRQCKVYIMLHFIKLMLSTNNYY
jgi:hypothetical protein